MDDMRHLTILASNHSSFLKLTIEAFFFVSRFKHDFGFLRLHSAWIDRNCQYLHGSAHGQICYDSKTAEEWNWVFSMYHQRIAKINLHKVLDIKYLVWKLNIDYQIQNRENFCVENAKVELKLIKLRTQKKQKKNFVLSRHRRVNSSNWNSF